MTLLVAATERELCGLEGLVCGIGPVEAAAATARALARVRPNALLHVGIAGGRGIAPPTLVLGSEAVYCDADLGGDPATRVLPDPGCLAALREALPGAPVLADRDERAGSAARRRSSRSRRWRASPCCGRPPLAGVPAVELRAVSNEVGRAGPRALADRRSARGPRRGDPSAPVGARVSGSSLPPPLPPETRTVGQLVAESIRLYGNHFWRVLPLGLALALIDQVSAGRRTDGIAGADPPRLRARAQPRLRARVPDRARDGRGRAGTFCRALGAGTLAFLPVPFLVLVFVLPGLAWLALVGLVVPAILYEDLSVRAGFGRALRLARADYVHALGSLATLVIVFVLTRLVLVLLLHGQADATARIAAFLADLVISPLILVGAALLYFDQAARVRYSPDEQPVQRG